MNTKQSIIAGAVFAALLVTGPIAWRANQIHRAEKSLAAVSPIPTARNKEETAAKVAGSPPPAEKTKSARTRFAKPLSEADRQNMMAALPRILEENIKAAMTEWCERDAWLEARNTAAALELPDAMETELRQFLVSEHASDIDQRGADGAKADQATQRREGDARRDAWFTSRLNPQQMESFQNLKETKNVVLAGKLAAAALLGMSEKIDLTDEQKSHLHDVALAKANRSIEEKTYSKQVGFNVTLNQGVQGPIEENSEDFVRSILSPDQQKVWNVMLERDRALNVKMQKSVLGGVIEQLKKVQPTLEELRKLGR